MKTALMLALLPLAAHAEPQPVVAALMQYMEITSACFDGAEDSAEAGACVGQGATICMETEQDGYTTVGMMFCTLAEYEAWDVLLNRDFGSYMEYARMGDDEMSALFPEFANGADSLLAAQRAWIPYRDAQCALEYSLWGEGSMRQTAGASCLMDMTAKRVIYLRFMTEKIRG